MSSKEQGASRLGGRGGQGWTGRSLSKRETAEGKELLLTQGQVLAWAWLSGPGSAGSL